MASEIEVERQFLQALSDAQAGFKMARLDTKGIHKNEFASLNSLKLATETSLIRHGFVIYQTQVDSCLITKLKHIPTLEYLESKAPLHVDPKMPNVHQAEGSALTYTRRYQYQVITGVKTGEKEDDGEAAGHAHSDFRPPMDPDRKELTESESKMIYAKAMTAGYNATELVDWLVKKFGPQCTRTDKVPYDKFKRTCDWFDNNPKRS